MRLFESDFNGDFCRPVSRRRHKAGPLQRRHQLVQFVASDCTSPCVGGLLTARLSATPEQTRKTLEQTPFTPEQTAKTMEQARKTIQRTGFALEQTPAAPERARFTVE